MHFQIKGHLDNASSNRCNPREVCINTSFNLFSTQLNKRITGIFSASYLFIRPTPQYSWNTAKVGIKHKSINQSIIRPSCTAMKKWPCESGALSWGRKFNSSIVLSQSICPEEQPLAFEGPYQRGTIGYQIKASHII